MVTSTPENGKNDSYTTRQATFTQPDLDNDDDGDTIPNGAEPSTAPYPAVTMPSPTKTENGISAETAFRIASGTLATTHDGDGRIDGDDDSDGDGISNASKRPMAATR